MLHSIEDAHQKRPGDGSAVESGAETEIEEVQQDQDDGHGIKGVEHRNGQGDDVLDPVNGEDRADQDDDPDQAPVRHRPVQELFEVLGDRRGQSDGRGETGEEDGDGQGVSA